MRAYKIKEIKEYSLPDEYKKNLIYYYEQVKMYLKDRLKLFVLVGSCSTETVTVDFSDIDVMIVVDRYDFNTMIEIENIRKFSTINISTNVYSKKEFESCALIDKNMTTLFYLSNGYIFANYLSNDLEIPYVSLDDLKLVDKIVIPNTIHKMKRFLYNPINNRELIQNLALLMKLYLRKHNIIIFRYQEIFDEFSKHFNFETYDLSNEIVRGLPTQGLIDYAKKLIENRSN